MTAKDENLDKLLKVNKEYKDRIDNLQDRLKIKSPGKLNLGNLNNLKRNNSNSSVETITFRNTFSPEDLIHINNNSPILSREGSNSRFASLNKEKIDKSEITKIPKT